MTRREARALAARIERDRYDDDPQVRDAVPVMERELVLRGARPTLNAVVSGLGTVVVIVLLFVVAGVM